MTKINETGARFTSFHSVSPQGQIQSDVGNSTIYTDYHLWSELSKGKGNKAYKAITDQGNLIYIIEK